MNIDTGNVRFWNELTEEEKESGRWGDADRRRVPDGHHDRRTQAEMMLLHSSGEYLLSNVVMPLAKNDPQGVGSAITYGRRYLVAAMLSLAADEDDDGNASSHKPEAVKAAASKPQPVKLAALDDPNIMPTGDYQGKPLGEVPTKELDALVVYCRSKQTPNAPQRYAARIAAIDAELLKRKPTEDEEANQNVARMHAAEDAHQAGLKLG